MLPLWLPHPDAMIQSEFISKLYKGIKMSSNNSEEKPGNKILAGAENNVMGEGTQSPREGQFTSWRDCRKHAVCLLLVFELYACIFTYSL